MDTEIGGTGHAQTMIVYLDDFIHRLDSGTIKLIDVRESSEIEETGSIPTSINIPRMTSIARQFVRDNCYEPDKVMSELQKFAMKYVSK